MARNVGPRGGRPRGRREKPTKGVCSSCDSTDLRFYDEGDGECLDCGRVFDWDRPREERAPPGGPRGGRPPPPDDYDDRGGRGRRPGPRDGYDDGYDEEDENRPGSGPPRGDYRPGPGWRPPAGVRGKPGPTDFEDDFDTDEDYEDEDGEGEVGEGKRGFEIKVGQPTITGVEKAVSEPSSQAAAVPEMPAAGIPKEYRERLKSLEVQVREVSERLEGISSTLEDLQGRVGSLNEAIERQGEALTGVEEVREGFNRVEATVNELSAIYDLVSAQINPFIDMGGYPKAEEEAEVDWDLVGELGDEDKTPHGRVKNPFIEDESEGSGKWSVKGGGDKANDEWADEEPVAIGTDKGNAGRGGGGAGKSAVHPLDEDTFRKLGPQKWLLRWTDFLLSRVGPEGLPSLLKYYKDLGWIDGTVEKRVMSYLSGIRGVDVMAAPAPGAEPDILIGPDGTAVPDHDSWKLTMEDHTRSLEFLEYIRDGQGGGTPKENAPGES